MNVAVGTFNVLNLARAGERYYPDEPPWTPAQYGAKVSWVGQQLRRMKSEVVGFQEVFHVDALRDACERSGRYPGATVVAPGADGVSGPRLGLATTLPVVEASEPVVEFPPGLNAEVDGVALPLGSFSRPVLRYVLQLRADLTLTVFVAHLKSKRPILDPAAPRLDPREEALGKARALVRRAAEAAALRFLVLDELVGADRPVVVLGDLNDTARAVSTDVVTGDSPSRFWPRDPAERTALWDRLLYSAHEISGRQLGRDVSYTHIFNGRYDNLDHILVSQEFHDRNPARVGVVNNVRYLNDHLLDSQLSDVDREAGASDHAQLVAELRLR